MNVYNKIINIKNFVYFTFLSMFICNTVINGEYINNNYYPYNSWDLTFQVLSSPKKIVGILSFFYVIGIYITLYKNNFNYIEIIRYDKKEDYYIRRIKNIIVYTLFFDSIFLFNLITSAFIKGRSFLGWGETLKFIHSGNEDFSSLIFMNGNMLNYKPLLLFIFYIIILTFYLILLGFLMEILNQYILNKSLIFLILTLILLVISSNIFYYNSKTFWTLIIYDHIDINMQGFKLFNNYYINLLTSSLYLLIIDSNLYFIGKKMCTRKEIVT